MKIAVGGIHTECSTYSQVLQTAADFKVIRGTDLLRQAGVDGEPFEDVTFCPLFHARSIPGGPVTADCYSAFKSAFLAELEASPPLDGVLLIMHGAMHVVGLEDAEGDWISAVRRIVGPRIPIAVSYDLHGNVTQTIVDQIDIFCAYRTAPHIDVPQTHRRAAENLVDQLRGGHRRYVAWAPIPALLPGERTSTEDEPARSLYAKLSTYDQRHGVSDANLMVGYVWADTARATAAAVVTGTDRSAIQKAAIEIAADYWSARQDFVFGVATKPLDQCLGDAKAATSRPFILADSGDNPTGGGVGDRADVLAAWLDQGLTDGVFAGIADPVSVEKLWNMAAGSQAHLNIGGALGSTCPVVACDVVLLARTGSQSDHDREVLVEVAGNMLILTEHRRPFHYLDDFRRFGIEPSTVRCLIVKSGYLSPELAPIANPARMALTNGAVNQDIERLENRNRPVPCHPFQQSFDWRPVSWLSCRAAPCFDTINATN